MKAQALFVALVVVAGCSSAGPSPTASAPGVSADPSPSAGAWPARDERFVPITGLEVADDGRTVAIRFTGAKQFDPVDPCSAAYDARAAVLGGVLDIGVFQSRPPRPAVPPPCDGVGFDRNLVVELDEPFAGVAWRDLFGPYVHFLAPPPGLVELTGLPDGWILVSERDVEESPTGRWERKYGQPDAPPDDPTRTVVLYQSFDGPVGVTGGAEGGQVTVSGEAASLYRDTSSGELVLTWSLGADGLALVAYEQTFSADMLIKLAESVRPTDE